MPNLPRLLLLLLLPLFCLSAPAEAATGQQTYNTRCSMCHQPSGAGLPGQFPRLSGRVAQIAATRDGRDYLVKLLLHGMSGSINVDGKPISGLMPGAGSLSDADIAEVLNYSVNLKKVGKPAPFTEAEVAKVRAAGKLSANQVAALRTGLAVRGAIP